MLQQSNDAVFESPPGQKRLASSFQSIIKLLSKSFGRKTQVEAEKRFPKKHLKSQTHCRYCSSLWGGYEYFDKSVWDVSLKTSRWTSLAMLKKRKMCPTVIMHADLIVFRLNGEILDFPGAYKEVSRDPSPGHHECVCCHDNQFGSYCISFWTASKWWTIDYALKICSH